MSQKSPFPRNERGGKIDIGRDYSRFLGGFRSKLLIVVLALLPYTALSIFLFLEGLEIIAVVLLLIPLLLFFSFWIVLRLFPR